MKARARSHAEFTARLGIVLEEADGSEMWTEVTADRVWGIPEQRAWLLDESRQLRVLQSCNSPVISLRPVFVMRVAREYVVSGRVQGVGFRYFSQAAAVREVVSGWVQNLPDGRVAIVAEGAADALERFEREIRRGPPGALVERVDIRDAACDEHRTGFSIR